MQFLLLAVASMAIATPVVQKREAHAGANTGLAARQFEAYGGYYPQGQGPNIYNGNGNGNSGDGNGNSGSGNGNSGNNSGNGNGNNIAIGGDDDITNNDDDAVGNDDGAIGGDDDTVGNDDDVVGGDDGNNGGDDDVVVTPFDACTGLSDTPQCCSTDVLGVADLDCAPVEETITSRDNFIAQCAALGQRARCCAVPLLGQGLICTAPTA